MRKLKKTLAVLLVLVMALTIVPFAGASVEFRTVADFNDAADVSPDQRMALDVLAAVNVLRGENGSIFPQRNVTRAEAALIVARTVFGPDTADQLPLVLTGFRDVDGQGWDWAAPAIAQLHEQGIVVGIGDGLFNPNGNVTSAELAAMFLRAVGFGVNGEFAGPRWQTNAIVYGMQWRVLAGVGEIDFTAPATREQVMQYAFNSMNVTESAFGLRFVHWSTIHGAYEPIELIVAGVPIVQTIYRRVFNVQPIGLVWNLTLDQFARPADRFLLRGRLIGEYTRAAAVEFTANTSRGAVDAAISAMVINPNIDIQHAINGQENVLLSGTNPLGIGDLPGTGVFEVTPSSLTTRGQVAAAITSFTGNGILVEVFTNFWNDITHITAIRADITTVTSNDRAGNTVTMMTMTSDGTLGGQAPGTAIRTATFGVTTSFSINTLHPLWDEVSDLEVGTHVLLMPAYIGGDTPFTAGEIYFPETVTGVLTASAPMTNLGGGLGSLSIGAQTFPRARILSQGAANAVAVGLDAETTLIVDGRFATSYLVHAETGYRSTRQFMFVNRGWQGNQVGLVGGTLRAQATGLFPDGTATTVHAGPSIGMGPVTAPDGSLAIITTGAGADVGTNDVYVESGTALTASTGISGSYLPATFTSGIATLASMADNVTSITARQPALLLNSTEVGNPILVPFATDALFFRWSTAGGGRWVTTERTAITAAQLSDYDNNGHFIAVVEYRQQQPVITALLVPLDVQLQINPDNVMFITGWSRNAIVGNPSLENTFTHVTAWDMSGNQLQGPDGLNGVPIAQFSYADDTLAHTDDVLLQMIRDIDGIDSIATPELNGFFTFSVTARGLFELHEYHPDHLDDNFGFNRNVIATMNRLHGQYVIIDISDDAAPFATTPASLARALPVTGLGPAGPAPFTIGTVDGLVRLLDPSSPDHRSGVRISIAYDTFGLPLGNAARGRVFVHSWGTHIGAQD